MQAPQGFPGAGAVAPGGYGGAPAGYPNLGAAPLGGGYPAAPSDGGDKDTSGSLMDDLSMDALLGAVTSGLGFAKPRILGAALSGLGLLFLIGNLVLIVGLEIYFPWALILVPTFGLAGLFMLVTGEPARRKNAAAAPMWTRIGLAACLILGVLVGIGLAFVVKLA